jgi:hypothetical protein
MSGRQRLDVLVIACALLAFAAATPAAAQPVAAPLALSAADAGNAANCANRDVTIAAGGGHFSLQGGCRSLSVRGDGVRVDAEMQPGSAIDVEGAGSIVTYFLSRPGAGPAISVSGSGSRVNRAERLGGSAIGAALAPEGAPPPIVLAGDGERQSAACGGRDVEISGNNGTYTLPGGCRSLSVTGSGNAVQAEMMPGTRIAITGDRNVIAFVPSEQGTAPIVSLRGSNSHAWRVQRLGDDPTSGVEVTQGGISVPRGPGTAVTEMPNVPQVK